MKRLSILFATMALLGTLFAFSAAPAVATCAQAKITVYPSANGGGTPTTFCYNTDIPNLGSKPSGSCGVFPSWNDCISSVTFDQGTVDTAVCLFNNATYTGSGLRFINDITKYNLGSTWNDQTSSIEWGNNCLEAGS